MNYKIITRFEQLTLGIKIRVSKRTKIRVKVVQKDRPLTVFTDRYKTVNSESEFYVRMPLTPQEVVVSVYDDDLDVNAKNNNIEVLNIQKYGLKKRMDEVDFKNRLVMHFVDFSQRFSFNASYLKADTYESDFDGFKIEYLEKIVDNFGKVIKTPARISKTTGRIQISKDMFKAYTVPMRMAILLHEFSHFYLNENIDDETEADLNGLLIYLALGYPRIEGYEAFLEVFIDSPSDQNKERYDIINKFIKDFETNKFVMK